MQRRVRAGAVTAAETPANRQSLLKNEFVWLLTARQLSSYPPFNKAEPRSLQAEKRGNTWRRRKDWTVMRKQQTFFLSGRQEMLLGRRGEKASSSMSF